MAWPTLTDDKSDIQHWVDRLGLDRQAALTKWDEQVKVAKYSNNNGPVGQTLQIPVKVDEFLILEDAVIDEKSRELEHKRVKRNEEVQDLMEEGLKGRAATAEAIAEYGLSGMDNRSRDGWQHLRPCSQHCYANSLIRCFICFR